MGLLTGLASRYPEEPFPLMAAPLRAAAGHGAVHRVAALLRFVLVHIAHVKLGHGRALEAIKGIFIRREGVLIGQD